MNFIRCQNTTCRKNLLKIGHFDELSIKCSRCKNINTFSNVKNVPSEDHESQTILGKTRGNAQNLSSSSATVHWSKA